MQTWIIYTFLSALFAGLFKCAQKKSGEKNSTYEVLAGLSLIGFLFSLPLNRNVFDINFTGFSIVLLKSSFVLVAWLLSLYALFKMPLSLYSVINLGKVIFSIILSILLLGERLTLFTFLGMVVVLIGLFLVNIPTQNKRKKETSLSAVIMLIVACFFNSCSAMADKIIMSFMTPGQTQFWFLFLLTISFWIIVFIKRKKINFKKMFTNPWIYVAGFSLTISNQFLFRANAQPESLVSIITIIKQLSAVEMIIFGKIFLKEKNIIKKLACSTLIIAGIILTLI